MRDGHPAAVKRPVASTMRLLSLATAYVGGDFMLTDASSQFKTRIGMKQSLFTTTIMS